MSSSKVTDDGVQKLEYENEQAVGAGNNDSDMDELALMEAELREQEEEQRRLKQIQSAVEEDMNSTRSVSSQPQSLEDKSEADARSIYVGNVDYAASAEDLKRHFHGCGSITRVTILCDKFTGHPKGFAYVEFSGKEGMQNALEMNESLFCGRQIKVTKKRTNMPGFSSTTNHPSARGRGQGYYGYYRSRGPFKRRPTSYHY